ncbi:molybdopterin converting factor subunit 1 [Shouchella lehensis]|uniref:Molybdopterin synthase sulfur carrier subunit n=1 Tax=Shouchella lehensis TaxID=300825 RepID=A0A4Y7WS13_9BACI|nr:molybdopterin converting factor subunit 1 [Shouchella lehensis]MBG9783612.1 hypothetical protein [Shouchella lehensis]TES51439.1 molybdopterin converting factor subunit 1 [Shouchella lehensis]
MITVLFFAGLEEQIGQQRLALPIAGKAIFQLKAHIEEVYELENDTLQGMMVAVNEEFATDDTVLVEQDTVAFIPPVSGG